MRESLKQAGASHIGHLCGSGMFSTFSASISQSIKVESDIQGEVINYL